MFLEHIQDGYNEISTLIQRHPRDLDWITNEGDAHSARLSGKMGDEARDHFLRPEKSGSNRMRESRRHKTIGSFRASDHEIRASD
jgi:hypothetical protein